MPELAHLFAVDGDALHTKTLRVGQNSVFGSRHGMLPDENNAVVEFLREVIVGRCRTTLEQFRAARYLIHGESAAAVVTIPNHDFSSPGSPRALHRRAHFTGEQTARFRIAPLTGEQLLVAIVDAAHSFQIGDDEDPRAVALRQTRGGQQDGDERFQFYLTGCSSMLLRSGRTLTMAISDACVRESKWASTLAAASAPRARVSGGP